jgi:hypothetical protein
LLKTSKTFWQIQILLNLMIHSPWRCIRRWFIYAFLIVLFAVIKAAINSINVNERRKEKHNRNCAPISNGIPYNLYCYKDSQHLKNKPSASFNLLLICVHLVDILFLDQYIFHFYFAESFRKKWEPRYWYCLIIRCKKTVLCNAKLKPTNFARHIF